MRGLEQSPLVAAQNIMIDMLSHIHQICVKHNIKYWISDGTLLGAVRHQGFIPWDDDADISMLREDYNKFIRVIEEELPHPYKIESVQANTHGLHNWCKIMYMEDFEWVDWHGNLTQGLSVDVFPYDYVPTTNKGDKTLLEKAINRVASITYPLEGNNIKNITRRAINKAKIHNVYIKLSKKTNVVTYGIETPYYGWAYFEVDDIFPLRKAKFANHEFYIPNNYDKCLTLLYGDYMQLPKVEDRVSHMSNLRFAKR